MVYFQTKLRNWINPQKLNLKRLSKNLNGVEFMREYINEIDWSSISSNKTIKNISIINQTNKNSTTNITLN